MFSIQSHPVFLTPTRLQPDLPLLVFLPGMDGTGQLFRSQMAGVEAGFDVRCLAIPPDDLTSWEELAQQVVNLIHQELAGNYRRPVYLCGESFGGCLALKVARTAPELFQRLILVNPASSFNRRPWLGWGGQTARWLPEPLYRCSSILLLPLLANFGRMTDPDRKAFIQTVQSVPQSTTLWRMALLSQFYLSDQELAQITQPTLILAASSDRLLPSVQEAERLQQSLPNARVIVLPYSGHVCLMEADVNLHDILQAQDFLPQQVALADP